MESSLRCEIISHISQVPETERAVHESRRDIVAISAIGLHDFEGVAGHVRNAQRTVKPLSNSPKKLPM